MITFSKTNHKQNILNLAAVLALAGLFFIPVSPSLNALLVVAALLTLLAGQWREQWKLLTNHSAMNLLAVSLLILFFIGAFHNPFGLSSGLKGFYKYLTHFVILFFLPIAFIHQQKRRLAYNAIILSAVLTAAFSVLCYLLPQTAKHYLHRSAAHLYAPIPYGILLAYSVFMLAHRIIDEPPYRYMYLLCLPVLLFTLFYINIERTGIVVLLALVLLFTFQRWGIKGMLVGGLITLTSLFVVYKTSVLFRIKLHNVVTTVTDYENNQKTSVGYRLTFLTASIDRLKEKPMGYGTGLYTHGIGTPGTDPHLRNGITNPENSYLHVALQIGGLGLIIFLAWLILQWFSSYTLPFTDRILLQGIVVTMAISNCFIIAFYLNQTSMLYYAILALTLSASNDCFKPAR